MMDLTAFYSQFRDETVENVRTLHAGLLALEAAPEADERRVQIDSIFRAMHTIKGSARLLGFAEIGQIAHECENVLGAVRTHQRSLDRPLADQLLRAGDAILALVTAAVDGGDAHVDVAALVQSLGSAPPVDSPPVAPQTSEPGARAVDGTRQVPTTSDVLPAADEASIDVLPVPARTRRVASQTVRVRVDRLDRLLNLAGELAVGHLTQTTHLHILEEVRAVIGGQQRALLALEVELQRLRFSPAQREALDRHLNALLNAGEQATKLIKGQAEIFGQHVNHTELLVEDLEQEVMTARLLPIATLFANLPRAVRELARDTGKEMTLTLAGETTELDRKVIEALNEPLVHLIRNAVDHGVEPPHERAASGKPSSGVITVTARALGAYVQLSVSDDGRGMVPDKLRQTAIHKGLITATAAAQLNDQEALELVFLPGFSTAPLITDISGRGVGMDVVRTRVVELGGQVQIDSQHGRGTTTTLTLPLTLVTTRVILVEVAEQTFGLPASGCQGTTWTLLDHVPTVEGRAMITHDQRLTPLLRLADLLELRVPPLPARRRVPTLLIGTAQRPLALLVDRLVDEREVVIKPLGPLLERQRRYSGAIQMGDGGLVLLLNPAVLMQMARGMALATPAARRELSERRRRLLVADDSFTTRELIRSILQSAGYDVTTATDGGDALDKLRANPYDLVVSDVEMPRVDGFQLTTRIRQELGRTTMPVIIVTSLASDDHKRRGMEAGAQAYIVKSQFNQGNLLETVRQLLGYEGVGG